MGNEFDYLNADDDPVAKGITKLGETIAGLQERQRVDRETLDAQMEAGFKAIKNRQDVIAKQAQHVYSGGGPSGNPMYAGVDFQAALTDGERKTAQWLDRSGHVKDNGLPADAQALAGSWLRAKLAVDHREVGGDMATALATLDRTSKALNPYTSKAAYAEGADATGGYGVPEIVGAEVLRIAKDASFIVSGARHVPMSSDTLNIPNEASDFTTYWVAEASTLTAGENTLGQNILTAKKIAGRAQASIEVVQDAAFPLANYVMTIMGEGIARELDQEALEGDGTNFTGINGDAGINTVATTATDGEALVFGDLLNTAFTTTPRSTKESAVWVMHPNVYKDVLNMTDDAGSHMFFPGPGFVGQEASRNIFGFPVILHDVIDTNVTRGATGGTTNVYFGRLSTLIVGDRQDLRFESTLTGPGWETFSVDMRMVGRFGFTVGTPAAWTRLVGIVPSS